MTNTDLRMASKASDSGLRLVTLPGRVFKRAPDINREGVEGWGFFLGIESPSALSIVCESLEVSLLQVDALVGTRSYPTLAMVALGNSNPGRLSQVHRDLLPPRFLPWVIRLRFQESQRLEVNRLRLALTARDQQGQLLPLTLELPVEQYSQKTKLLFPFRGPGILMQGGLINEGHRNRSGQFAVDALSLTEHYAPEIKASSDPDSYAGWGRPILTPAAGRVVFERRDRPDQPVVENSDPAFYAPEYPNGGDPGNYIIIDHGNGEFSMLAHFQKDSLSVVTGQQVEQGQHLGLLGNSGDTTGPHLHHQLQSGPDWEFADALPHVYENGPGSHHDRGWYFTDELHL